MTFYLDSNICAEADWRQRASCRTTIDPDVFFPVGSTGPALDQIEAAKSICATCVVRTQCLEWALRTNQDNGVWGGLSEEERKSIRRQPAYAYM
ncbi:MAG: WhiB family transcriptional regulator [Actinomycetota bacterium]